MRSQRAVLAVAVLSIAGLAACDNNVVGGFEDGAGGGSGGGGPTGGDQISTGPNSTAVATTSTGDDGTGPSSASTSTGASGDPTTGGSSAGCSGFDTFRTPGVDACANAACCPQLTVCADDPSLCGDGDDISPDTAAGLAVYECVIGAGCYTSDPQVCDAGVAIGGDGAGISAACMSANCCDEMTACMSLDGNACLDCVNGGGGPLCDPVIACWDGACDGPPLECNGLPDVDLFDDYGVDACISRWCCHEAAACADAPSPCVGNGDAIDVGTPEGAALAACFAEAVCEGGLWNQPL